MNPGKYSQYQKFQIYVNNNFVTKTPTVTRLTYFTLSITVRSVRLTRSITCIYCEVEILGGGTTKHNCLTTSNILLDVHSSKTILQTSPSTKSSATSKILSWELLDKWEIACSSSTLHLISVYCEVIIALLTWCFNTPLSYWRFGRRYLYDSVGAHATDVFIDTTNSTHNSSHSIPIPTLSM